MSITKRNAGFTLIEIMVALSIFTVVAVIATGAILTANNINKKSQAIKLVMDNLNFALDSMTLKLKQGGGYYCDSATSGNFSGSTPTYPTNLTSQDCVLGNTAIGFKLESGSDYDYYIYRFSGGQLQFSKRVGSVGSMSPYVSITASELNITNGRFYVFDNDQANKQPRVLISVYGTATAAKQTSTFAIQTTVSDRR